MNSTYTLDYPKLLREEQARFSKMLSPEWEQGMIRQGYRHMIEPLRVFSQQRIAHLERKLRS
jgi:hypothetical protein